MANCFSIGNIVYDACVNFIERSGNTIWHIYRLNSIPKYDETNIYSSINLDVFYLNRLSYIRSFILTNDIFNKQTFKSVNI